MAYRFVGSDERSARPKLLTYNTERYVRPDDIKIEIDEHFYTHHGRRLDEWDNLLNLAKSAGNITQKRILGQELTEQEALAEQLYYGEGKPRLTIGPDGHISVTDGRHRLQALKETGTVLRLQMQGYVELLPVKAIEDVYKKHKIFKTTGTKWKEEIAYIIAEPAIQCARQLNQHAYSAMEITDAGEEKQYVVVARDGVIDAKTAKDDIDHWLQNGIKLYRASGKIYQEGMEK